MVAARDFPDGAVVNLGLGLPVACSNHVPTGREVLLHSEQGLLGFGPVAERPEDADPYVTNASGGPVVSAPGMAVIHSHEESFAMIRGGHVDIAVLGALQVDAEGNLANTHVPGKPMGNLGGAPDIAIGARRLIVLMHHTTTEGAPKVMRRCTMPLTALACVDRIVTDVAVMDIADGVITLSEYAPGWDSQLVQAITDAPLRVPANVREIRLG